MLHLNVPEPDHQCKELLDQIAIMNKAVNACSLYIHHISTSNEVLTLLHKDPVFVSLTRKVIESLHEFTALTPQEAPLPPSNT